MNKLTVREFLKKYNLEECDLFDLYNKYQNKLNDHGMFIYQNKLLDTKGNEYPATLQYLLTYKQIKIVKLDLNIDWKFKGGYENG